jgi:hypothetical protein
MLGRTAAFLLCAAALFMLPIPAGAIDGVELASFPPSGQLSYSILRDGDQIGSQSVDFVRNGNRLIVHTRVSITVKILGITVYDFKHKAEEEWTGGRLTRLTSVTDDDGEDRKIELALEDGMLRGLYNGAAREFAPDIIPASLWHPKTVNQTVLLDQVKARTRDVQVVDRGLEQISIQGKLVSARHYSMTGQIKRELWYGPDGQLALLRFPAKDGSEITVKLR